MLICIAAGGCFALASPKKQPAKKTAAASTQSAATTIALPAAHAGVPYSVHIYLPTKFAPGWISYTLDPAPHWLSFDEATSTLTGIPDETATVTYTGVSITLKSTADAQAKAQVFHLTLPVIVGSDVAFPSGASPSGKSNTTTPKQTGSVVTNGSQTAPLPVPSVSLSSEVTTASTVLSGNTDPQTLPTPVPPDTGSPAGAAPKNFPQLGIVAIDPLSHASSLLSISTGAKGSSQGTSVPINKDGTFQIALPSTLTAGTKLTLLATPPSGYSFVSPTIPNAALDKVGERQASPEISVQQAVIPLPIVSLSGVPSAGLSAISGQVAPESLPPSPSAAVAEDPKTGNPASPGNLPSLAVEITDPLTKLVTRTPLALSGSLNSSATQMQIGVDGSFSLGLKSPLVSGQKIRIIAIPPQGYAFASLPAGRCNFGNDKDFKNGPSLVGADECVVAPDRRGEEILVFASQTVTEPVVSSKLGLNVTSISGMATPSTTGTNGSTILIGVIRYPLGNPCRKARMTSILTSDEMDRPHITEGPADCHIQLADLSVAASGSTPATTAKTVQTQANGTFALTLATPLMEMEKIRIAQIFPPGTQFPDRDSAVARAYSGPIEVPAVADWGRIHADFAAGLLVTNNNLVSSADTGNFSQAHQFLNLTVEKGWSVPGCYVQRPDGCLKKLSSLEREKQSDTETDKNDARQPQKARRRYSPKSDWDYKIDSTESWWQQHHPGIMSYFEGRFTAIPVATAGSSSSSNGSANSGSSSNSSTSTSPLSSNLLTTAQTARFGGGVYMPALLERWNWHGTPNALFIAPLAKIGFDSVTGASTINVPAGTPGASSSGTVTIEPLYNFFGYGARIGHFLLSSTESKAPETQSYIDVILGPYSNLQSYVCHKTPAEAVAVATTTTDSSGKPSTANSTIYVAANNYPAVTTMSGSTCAADYGSYYQGTVPAGLTYTAPPNVTTGNPTITYTLTGNYSFQPWDSRKRMYRLDFEGLLKIPMTPLYMGFNANLGQKTFGAVRLDHGYAAPDSLEIFFGTKFDIGELFAKIGINPF